MPGPSPLRCLTGFAGTMLLLVGGQAQAQVHGTADESARLAAITRELDTIDQLAHDGASLPARNDGRYHFDYARLHSDIDRVRGGLHDYLAPTRAQPRDPGALSGHYRIEVPRP